jgi:PAS domain S-box-containing protein
MVNEHLNLPVEAGRVVDELFARSPRSTQVLGAAGETLFVNSAWQRLWGLSLADLSGYNIRQDPQLLAKGVAPYLERSFAGEAVEVPPIAYQIEFGPTIGQVRWVRSTATPIADEFGSIQVVVLVHEDVTDRMEAEQAQARLAAIVESSRDAIHGRTLDGIVTDWNHAAQELYGYTAAEIVGRHVSILVPPGKNVELVGITERLTRGERIPPYEAVRARKDGSLVTVELTLSPTVDSAGRVVGVSGISRDVSDRQAARDEQRAFLEAVSHDLKNPLTSVRAQTQMLERRLRMGIVPDVELLTRMATTVGDATRRIEAQIDELQDVVQLRTGRPLVLRTAPTDLVALVRAAAEDAHATTADHEVRFACEQPQIVGDWDPIRLRRVLDNLLGNAIKYSLNGGQIAVTVDMVLADERPVATVSVRDGGVGIPAADLPYITDRYRRGSNVGQRIIGTGIGLAGARQIVEQHGGRIAIESEEGAGSTFTIFLPGRA